MKEIGPTKRDGLINVQEEDSHYNLLMGRGLKPLVGVSKGQQLEQLEGDKPRTRIDSRPQVEDMVQGKHRQEVMFQPIPNMEEAMPVPIKILKQP